MIGLRRFFHGNMFKELLRSEVTGSRIYDGLMPVFFGFYAGPMRVLCGFYGI